VHLVGDPTVAECEYAGKKMLMHGAEFDPIEDEPGAGREPEPDIDYDADQIEIRDGAGDGPPPEDIVDDEGRKIDNAELDNALGAFVDVVNGRDFDGLEGLLGSDAESEFLGAMSRVGIIDGLSDLVLRYPTLLLTRGDLGSEPIVGLWTFDFDGDRFEAFGFMTLDMSDSEQGLIQRISYIDELTNDDLVVESPDRSDLPEWDDWSELDED
jgi:hypothetical protein